MMELPPLFPWDILKNSKRVDATYVAEYFPDLMVFGIYKQSYAVHTIQLSVSKINSYC
jgi:hypothetical protein